MDLDYTLIGSRVNDLRKSQGISQERLAELADLSTTFISHIERSDKKPSLGALIRLASALGVTVDFLLAGNQPSDRNAYMPDVENLLSDCEIRILHVINRRHRPEPACDAFSLEDNQNGNLKETDIQCLRAG